MDFGDCLDLYCFTTVFVVQFSVITCFQLNFVRLQAENCCPKSHCNLWVHLVGKTKAPMNATKIATTTSSTTAESFKDPFRMSSQLVDFAFSLQFIAQKLHQDYYSPTSSYDSSTKHHLTLAADLPLVHYSNLMRCCAPKLGYCWKKSVERLQAPTYPPDCATSAATSSTSACKSCVLQQHYSTLVTTGFNAANELQLAIVKLQAIGEEMNLGERARRLELLATAHPVADCSRN